METVKYKWHLNNWQMVLVAFGSCLLWLACGYYLPLAVHIHVSEWQIGISLATPVLAVLLALLWHYKLGVRYPIRIKGLLVGLLMGWPFIWQAITYLPWTKALYTIYDWQTYRPMFMLVVLESLLTGIEEELLFRGTLMGLLKKAFADRKHANLLVIGLSAVFFGLLHLTNMTADIGSNQQVIQEALSAVAFGIFMGTIYLLTNNLLPVILLHTMQDIQPLNTILCRHESAVKNYSFDWSGIISGLLLIVLAIALSACYWWLSSYLKKRRLRAAVK